MGLYPTRFGYPPRMEFATRAQRAYLEVLKVEIPKYCTKAQASRLIDEAKTRRQARTYVAPRPAFAPRPMAPRTTASYPDAEGLYADFEREFERGFEAAKEASMWRHFEEADAAAAATDLANDEARYGDEPWDEEP